MTEADGCATTVTLPTGESVTCNMHKANWHTARTRATWPDLPDGACCGAWGVADTAEGNIFVQCARHPGHESEQLRHFAKVAGFPKLWH